MSRKSRGLLDLEEAYRDRNNEGHFFDKDTMKFFASKIHEVLKVGVEFIFIESQKACFNDESRVFSVRKMNSTGSISTIIRGTYNECKKTITKEA